MNGKSIDENYKKVLIKTQKGNMELGFKKHYLNAIAERLLGGLMGVKINENVDAWKNGDPGIDFTKDGLYFDVVYNPDPKGDLYLSLDKPFIADVYILVTGNDCEMSLIGWVYKSDFIECLNMSVKKDGDMSMITMPQKDLRGMDDFKWFKK